MTENTLSMDSMDTYTLTINDDADGAPLDTPLSLTYYHSPKGKPQSAQAPALLFLHGILGDGRTWAPILKAFPEFDTYAVTQSGFGAMNEGQEDASGDTLFDTDRHADELIAFCTALNTQENRAHRPFIIVAWSYACHVALLALEKTLKEHSNHMHQTLFQSLICYELIVPSYGISAEDQALFTRDISKMMSPIIKAYRRKQTDTAVNAFIAACKNSDAEYTLMQQCDRIQSIKQDNHHTLSKLLSQITPRDISAEVMATIAKEIPITILCGENSRGIFQLASKAGANALGQSSWIIPNADHLMPENEPLQFAAEIKVILGLQ